METTDHTFSSWGCGLESHERFVWFAGMGFGWWNPPKQIPYGFDYVFMAFLALLFPFEWKFPKLKVYRAAHPITSYRQ
ncbi:hypothetical protein C8P63_10445 [Melghirimyces profundicolus]|uniref:Uncharacterized protein n=1 Tax=Melghirimyces profundicolus TaxID=1242148 RepID=A0A2T6C4E1_9BACL|nr:hypothetical protein [Melghirimyces profundicolus]PTX63201.1 hypothetical protein C8P63_10445 [Melghirimyces profundicolus]